MNSKLFGVLTTHLFRYLRLQDVQAIAGTCKGCRTALTAAQPDVWLHAARQRYKLYIVHRVRVGCGAPLNSTAAAGTLFQRITHCVRGNSAALSLSRLPS